MRLPYTDDEICALYRRSANKRVQIQILADMNVTSEETIRDILRKYGYTVEERKPRKPRASAAPLKKKKKLDDLLDRYKAAADKGLNAKEAAKVLGVSLRQVRRYAEKHGIKFEKEG